MIFDTLEKILHPKLIITPQNENIVIEEEKKNEKGLKAITIKNFPKEIFVFALDGQNKGLKNQYLSINKGVKHHKGCDGIFIYQEADKFKVIFCELKSFDTSGTEYQLVNSSIFLDYICQLAKILEKVPFEIEKPQFVLIYLKKEPRLNTRAKSIKQNLNPYTEMVNFKNYHMKEIAFYSDGKKNVREEIKWQDLIT